MTITKAEVVLTLARILLLVLVAVLPQVSSAQESVTIVEPGMIELPALFKMSDTVALVRILSGDTESYSKTVYKAEVLKSFKGPSGTIYFGPYIGLGLGEEYVLFLKNVAAPLVPKTTSNMNYGTVRYSSIFNEGYSKMETSYECVFDGKTIPEQCDYGVRICTDYIVLPKSLATFPPLTVDTDFGCRWVRKDAFLSMLGNLSQTNK